MLLRILQVLLETLVEVRHRVGPLLFALLDFVEFFLQSRGVLRIEDVGKVFDQQIGHYQPDLGRHELATDLLHVLALLDGAQNGSVCRGSANAALFEFLDQ